MSGSNRVRKNIIRGMVIITAVAFIIAGMQRGEAGEIMRKAVLVCLECIGIG